MKYYGNIELIGGVILNLIPENLAADPQFLTSDAGRVYFNTTTAKLRYNNGSEYIDVDNGYNPNLISALGSTWINADYSFNPTAFSGFATPLTINANSSFFDVLDQIDTYIANYKLPSLADIEDVSIQNSISTGEILFFTGSGFSFATLDNLISEFSTINTTSLNDIELNGNISSGQIYVWNNFINKFQNTTLMYDYVNNAASTSFTVNHNLGTQYCFVQAIDLSTNSRITPLSTVYNSNNVLTVTFAVPYAVEILVFAIPFN